MALLWITVMLMAMGASSTHGQTANNPVDLSWDPGTTETGTLTQAQPSTTAGSYYYRINTKTAEVWRTRLNVTSGEAQLYLLRGKVPVVGQPGVRASELTGSDGLVLGSADFAPGEDWYILVLASGVSNTWSVASGAAYVRDLGSLPYTDSNGDGGYNIGEATQNGGIAGQTIPPEGVVFYKVTLPPNVPAWSLWLNGGTQLMGVRKSKVPVLFTASQTTDRKQNGSMLLVPPYLGQGSDNYFVSVVGMAGTALALDSRIQQIESMAFAGEVPSFAVSAAPYRVFRVDVPAGQIVWDVALNRVAGDPSVAIKKESVPSETENDAVNEAPGAVNDSVSIVAPYLTNGTWFVTVYGGAAYETGIKSGPPVITDLGYRSEVTNDQALRSGWRYYRVPDFASQVGTLGWQLELKNAPQGTQLAIRRAQVPGIWTKRTGGSTSLSQVSYVDAASTNGILQRVDHEADIWYVGVYQPSLPLGAFQLTLNDITAVPTAMDGSTTAVVDQIEGEWRYFRVVIPNAANLLGWYLNLTGVSGTVAPKITVRRDRLPPSTSTVSSSSATWPSGAAWSQDLDFTGLMTNPGNITVTAQQFLAVKGTGRPLEAGTYYVGVLAGAAQAPAGPPKMASYTLQSRGIGDGYAMNVTPVTLDGGSATSDPLEARQFKFFSVTVPLGAELPSWRIDLQPTTGEMSMQVRRDSLPDFSTSANVGESTTVSGVLGGKRLKRAGAESLTLLPENGATFLQPGIYYIATISEGLTPTASVMGTGQATATLGSVTPAPVIQLDNLTAISPLAVPFDLAGGELAIYRLAVPAGMKVLEASLADRVGNPGLSVARGLLAPLPYPGTSGGNAGYGWVGGQTTTTHPVLVTVQDPLADTYTLVVRANADASTLPPGKGTLHIRLVETLPQLDVLGGTSSVTVTDQIAEGWRYFQLNVPTDARLKGIRVSLKNVTSGAPHLVIRKGVQMPKDFTSSNTLSSDSSSWPVNQQWAQANDFTNLQKDSSGVVAAGRYFLAAYNAPMDAGTYIIGVTKDASINTVSAPNTPAMNYRVVVEAVGDGLEIPITTLGFDNSAAPEEIVDLAEREMMFYKIVVPAGRTSWRIHLKTSLTNDSVPKVRDGGLAIRRDRIPAFDSGGDPNVRGGATARLVALDDHWALLPKTSDGVLEAGVYYIAVTSFGVQPTTSQTGTGSSSLTMISRGELPVTVFPSLSPDLAALENFTLGPAEIAAYELTVPARAASEAPYGLVLSINRTLGASNYSMMVVDANGLGFATPPGSGTDGYFGGLAALTGTTDDIYGRVFAEITPGTYRIIVRSSQAASSYANASGSLAARLLVSSEIPTLKFDDENLSVTRAGPTTDILQYRVEVPDEPNWQAWGIRLESPVVGRPAILIRRAQAVESSTGPSVNSDLIDWPLGYQWTQLDDFTKLKNDPLAATGSLDRDRSQQFFMASRERPLQPGTYYIGIDNRATAAISPRTFTIRTFAVGDGYTIPVTDLSAAGAEAPIAISNPRMPSVFKISIPPLKRGFAVALTPTLGDLTLRCRLGAIPDPVNDATYPDAKGGVHVQKSGDERFTLLPKPGNSYLVEGDYYFMAVSEGQNPSLASSVLGTGQVLGTIKNMGPIEVTALGLVTDAGLSQAVDLAAAEVKAYSVEVPAGINNLQFRLNNRSGEANIAILRGTQIAAPGISESYGVFGGETAGPPSRERSIINLGNPAAGIYTVVVRAAGTLPSSYAPATATLAIDVVKPRLLNFAQQLNAGNGLSNVDSRSLADKEKFFYRVPVPRQIDGADVLGWLVTLDLGSPVVRIYKSEADFGRAAAVTMVGRSALIVPPFLTFDSNWFIEVEGLGASDYILRSQAVALAAGSWALPASFNQLAGDSSPAAPDGLGIRRELSQDAWEFFAIDVPENNLGLLRLTLEQYTGNTNVYVRNGGIPTTDHSSAGTSGNKMFQYKMIAETSEAGNFSEISDTVKQPERLLPGRWYIGVKSEPLAGLRTGSGYRLKAHSGVVTDLNLTTDVALANQSIAERDWRYFRFTVPKTGIPMEWRPFFNRISGSAIGYLRDTLPPFSYVPATSSSASSPSFVDWGSDSKNRVPSTAYPKAFAPGTTSLPVPPLRPGATYFLGLYGNTAGGSVDVSSAVSTQQVVVDRELVYNSGAAEISVPALAARLVRIAVAADATRLRIETLQSALGLSLKLEQGAPPFTTTIISAHAQNAAPYPPSFTFNQALGTSWPFVPNRDYFLLLTNTTAATITSTLNMRGSTAATEDEDGDGLPDAWEIANFTNLSQTAGADFDGDGSTNLQEFQNGTVPKDASSVRYILTVRAPGGGCVIEPAQANFASGATVLMTAVPASGDSFRQWKSALAALNGITAASTNIVMSSNVDASAVFQTSLARGLDTPASLAWTPSGNGQWYGQYEASHDGLDAAVSPSVGANQQARITSTFVGPGTLSFWWKVSSRASSGLLTLLIDSVAQAGAISGTAADWAQVSVALPAGSHSVAWRYSRDSNSATAGENRAFVDQVSFVTPNPVSHAFADWLAAHFSTAELSDAAVSGPAADPDQDGIPNAIEAAIGSSPTERTPQTQVLTMISTTPSGAVRTNVLSARRAELPVTNLTLEVQGSTSLEPDIWTKLAERSGDEDWVITDPTALLISESAAIGGTVPCTIQETLPLAQGQRRFYRLSATVGP